MSSEKFTDDDFKILEDPSTLILRYKHAGDTFEIIYDKNKEKVLLMKNGKLCSGMRQDEKDKFHEMLELAINYNHDRESNSLH